MELRARLALTTAMIDAAVMREAWNEALPRMLHVVRTHAAQNLSGRLVGVRRGTLRASLQEVIQPGPSGLASGSVGTTYFTGHIFEGGARPHAITAKRGRRPLRFKVGPRWVSTRRVQHPGIRPRRWLAAAWETSQETLERLLTESIEATVAQRASREVRRG